MHLKMFKHTVVSFHPPSLHFAELQRWKYKGGEFKETEVEGAGKRKEE